jgi:hypothetical protein
VAQEKDSGFCRYSSDGHRLTEPFNSTVEISQKGLLSHVKDDGCCKIGWATKLSSVCRYLLVPINLPTYLPTSRKIIRDRNVTTSSKQVF